MEGPTTAQRNKYCGISVSVATRSGAVYAARNKLRVSLFKGHAVVTVAVGRYEPRMKVGKSKEGLRQVLKYQGVTLKRCAGSLSYETCNMSKGRSVLCYTFC